MNDVPVVLSKTSNILDRIDNTLGKLEGKLEPVLSSKKSSGVQTDKEDNTELDRKLINISDSLLDILRRVSL